MSPLFHSAVSVVTPSIFGQAPFPPRGHPQAVPTPALSYLRPDSRRSSREPFFNWQSFIQIERHSLVLGGQVTMQYVNNHIQPGHRDVTQRCDPTLGFGSFKSASRCCAGFDELRHYLRARRRGVARVSLAERRGSS